MAAAEPSGSTSVAVAAGASLVSSSVPPGVRVKWYQRKETVWIDIEAPDVQVERVDWEDAGRIEIHAAEPRHCVTLQLLHRIHTSESRWWRSGRCLKMELAKAEYGLPHWDRLTVGEKLPNVLVDWSSWIEEAEESEIRNAPYGHDVHSMASAMGAHWGSNVDRTIKAKEQAKKVDTSKPEDEDDEITMA